jgi:hypothetical protein
VVIVASEIANGADVRAIDIHFRAPGLHVQLNPAGWSTARQGIRQLPIPHQTVLHHSVNEKWRREEKASSETIEWQWDGALLFYTLLRLEFQCRLERCLAGSRGIHRRWRGRRIGRGTRSSMSGLPTGVLARRRRNGMGLSDKGTQDENDQCDLVSHTYNLLLSLPTRTDALAQLSAYYPWHERPRAS